MYELMRPVMRAWYAGRMTMGRSTPKPMDHPTVPATLPDADQVLLLGNGPLHGWGVLTHQISITGHLARETHGETARPCSVNYIGDETMNLASTEHWIGTHDLASYDAVVLVIGMNDAVRLTPLKSWEHDYRALLEHLTQRLKRSARIVVAGIQPVRSVTAFDHPLGALAEFHAGRMNKIVEDITDDFSAVTYFPLAAPAVEPGRPLGSSCMYNAWAKSIVTHLAPALDQVRAADPAPRHSPGSTEFSWSGTRRLIEQAETGGSPELQRLAALAQETFGVDIAVVSLLDGDRLWYAMNTEQLPKSIPKDLAYCNTVVEQDDFLIVPDAQNDPRFKGNPFIDVTGMDFYAGHPLHSTTGETIGTFCVLNTTPRPQASVSPEALRMIALQAETELRRYENA